MRGGTKAVRLTKLPCASALSATRHTRRNATRARQFLVDGGPGAVMLDQTGVSMPLEDLRSPCCKPREYPQREINKAMSRLTIVGYDDPDQAEEVRLKLRKLQRQYVMDLKDAV